MLGPVSVSFLHCALFLSHEEMEYLASARMRSVDQLPCPLPSGGGPAQGLTVCYHIVK